MKSMTKLYVVLSLITIIAVSCGPVTSVTTSLPVPSVTVTLTPPPAPISLSPSEGPDKEVSSYRLRTWTEEDYVQIVKSLDGLFKEDQGQIRYFVVPDYRVAFQLERLLKFPASSERSEILWNILLDKPETVAIPGVSTTDDLMSLLISDLLKQNIQPDHLSGELEKHQLELLSTIAIQNLIGNGEDGLVLLIKMYGVDAPLVGVFVIFRDTEGFHVQKIRDWEASEASALGRSFEIYNAGDTNGNGVPEIIVEVQARSSDIQKESIDHIEWSSQDKSFEASSFPVFWQTCDVFGEGPCEGDWGFATIDAENILVTRSYWSTRNGCPDLATQSVFRWNGARYVPGKPEVIPPSSDLSAECRLAWAETAIWVPSSAWSSDFLEPGWKNDLAISIVEKSLKHWPASADEIWGPASRDYFKLQLGLWYDFRNERGKMKALLEQVANHPSQAEYDFMSRLASVYLAQRASSGRGRACLELENVYFEESQTVSLGLPPYNTEEMLAAWGIADAKGLLCDVYDIWPADVKDARLTSAGSLMQWLEKTKLTIYQEIPVDLNNDGLEDHVILLDTTDSGSSDAWAFLGTPNGYQAAYINEIWTEDEQAKLNIQSIDIDNAMPVHLILSDEEDLFVFRITPDFGVENLWWEFGVQSFEINEMPISISVQIDTSYDGKRTVDYVWDSNIQNFAQQTDRFVAAQARIEKTLYSAEDYQGSIRGIDSYLQATPSEPRQAYVCSGDTGCKYLPEWYVPYFRYLRGLAYEQLGQNEEARQAYFELWQDFPGNVFGMAASLKLEPINP